jgi:cell wall-associated NlpC family hydrolase
LTAAGLPSTCSATRARSCRTASEQYAASSRVDQADKKPGDLIFTYDSSGIYHVGLYAGDGLMWAATKSGDVVRKQAIWTSSYRVGRIT